MSFAYTDTAARDERLPFIFTMLEALRTGLIRLGLALLVCSIAIFPFAEEILRWFQQLTGAPLAAFGVADAFLALVSISLGLASAVVMPYAAYEVLASAAAGFPTFTQRSRWIFWFFSVLLFYAGVWFCIWITLPYGCRFLLGYGSQELQAVISVRKFVSFCMLFIFGFGILFELPLMMTLSARLQLVKASVMARSRRYAVVLIITVSAIGTPTPDIFNLMLLAGPLYFLYEMGILGMRICERKPRMEKQCPHPSIPVDSL
jgi:sec-independent protein translocase protein TatC